MKEELEFICEDYKIKAKRLIEKRDLLNTLNRDSAEYKIQFEVMNNILKALEKYGEIIYSAILSYNHSPEEFTSLTKDDVLRLQLVQDEVTGLLKGSGINVNFKHPNDRNNDSKK